MCMTKYMVIPEDKNLEIYKEADAFLLGIENLCINFNLTFRLVEVKEYIKKYPDKEFFISLNKNMRNNDLDLLKETLLELDTMNIQGIFYYDVSVVELKSELNIKTDLVWHQEHLTTNFATANYWYQFGAVYTCLSSEITLEEMKKISSNAKGKLIVPVFGYIPMFTSARHVVKNYLTRFNLQSDDKLHYIKKEGYTYPIVDKKEGTTVYSSFILNSLEETLELKKENISYFLFNSFGVEKETFSKVLSLYKRMTNENKEKMIHEFEELHLNTEKGFLYKETVYKVK